MIETVYAQLSFGVLMLCGVLILLKRSPAHALIWVALAVYWSLSGMAQVYFNQNSIPHVTGPLSLAVGYAAVHLSARSRTYWPLVIAALMAVTALSDAAFAVYALTTDSPAFQVRRAHQDLSAIAFYGCLLCLSAHPKVRSPSDSQRKWVYS